MKNVTINNMLRLGFFPVFCFLFLLCISPAAAQSYLVDDGAQYTVSYNGSYQDFVIPSDVTYGQIKLTARGADGGRRHYGFLSCNQKGGGGATAVGTFTIGCGSGKLKPGSTIRFIVGHEGTSDSGGTIAGGGGGGGTGILYKVPGSSSWILLAVGGGGGGAAMNGVCSGSDGGNGRASTSGQDGGGTTVGLGGSGGSGGQYSTATSGGDGGGGYSGWGGGGTCGGGPGGTTGGQGGDGTCNIGRKGGFGFGGGGSGDQGGGGGGGYSGGGGGDNDDRGGGGGSYVNSIAVSNSTTGGTVTNSPDAGWCYYQFLNDTGSPIASVTAVCQAVTATIDNWPNSNSVTLTASQLAGNSTATCGSVQFQTSSFTFTDAQLYTTVPTIVTVKDGFGNTATCVSQVSVTTSIVAKCNDLSVNLNSSGSVTIQTSQVDNGSYDPDGDAVTAGFFLQGSSMTLNCAQVGTVSAMLWVSDAGGEAGYCISNVTVKDVNAPTVTCKTATVNLGSSGTATLSASSVFNTGSDNCSITTKTVSPSSFTCTNLGTNTVTLTVKDASNNAATCGTTVTVVDNTAPSVTCKNATVNLNSSGSGSITTSNVYSTGSDNCGTVNLVSVAPSNFTCSNIGANTVTLTVNDGHGNTNTCTATVTVADNSAPTGVTCKNATVYLNAAGSASLAPTDVFQSGSDNCGVVTAASVSPSSFSCSTLGGQTVTLTVNDGHGNTATCTAVVTVKDQIAPTAVCQNTTVQLASGTVTVTAASVTGSSTDNCAISTRIPVSTTYTAAGVYDYVITIKDASGNSSDCTSQVTVQSGLNNPGDRSTEETGNPGALDFSLSPNPTAGDANARFVLPADQPFVLHVLDMQGRTVLRYEGVGVAGQNLFPLRSGNFASGVYVVQFYSGEFRSQKRLVVQQ